MRHNPLIAAVSALLFVATAVPGIAAATPVKASYYVSLGDSLAASYQPNGDLDDGYAEQLYAYERHRVPGLQLHKLGCSGETT
jgi:hypothetical protein